MRSRPGRRGTCGAGRQWAPQRDADDVPPSITSWSAHCWTGRTPTMKLRRITAVAAIAAALAATTAAVYPRPAPDRLQPMPALTARPRAARYSADAHQIALAAPAARPAGHTALATSLAGLRRPRVPYFNPP